MLLWLPSKPREVRKWDYLFFLTSAQIRAARSLIRWTAEDLAAASALSVATIRRAELKENQTALTSANDLAIRRALESAGVEFIDENDGAQVSGCGSGSRKKARPGSNCKRRLSLRWLPPVERVGGADMMFYNRPAILPMLKRAVSVWSRWKR
jgi:transcriptional regulator with XRE-family HTH domain